MWLARQLDDAGANEFLRTFVVACPRAHSSTLLYTLTEMEIRSCHCHQSVPSVFLHSFGDEIQDP